jgi:uncharacterized tellurite resistance protein B-like protein
MSDTSTLHALAFLYLAFGHGTDGSMTGEEMRSLGAKLQEWDPETPLSELGEILKSTVAEYKAAEDKLAKAAEYTEALKETLSAEQARTILTDLRSIASADGSVSEAENAFIAETARAFGVAL